MLTSNCTKIADLLRQAAELVPNETWDNYQSDEEFLRAMGAMLVPIISHVDSKFVVYEEGPNDGSAHPPDSVEYQYHNERCVVVSTIRDEWQGDKDGGCTGFTLCFTRSGKWELFSYKEDYSRYQSGGFKRVHSRLKWVPTQCLKVFDDRVIVSGVVALLSAEVIKREKRVKALQLRERALETAREILSEVQS